MESIACSRQTYSHNILIIVTIFLFFLPKTCVAGGSEVSYANSSTEFIRSSCGATLYPDICYETLSAYASTIQTSPTQLANVALNVTLKSAQNVSNMVEKMSQANNLKPREASAIKDCVETLGDSVDKLQQSMVAMKYLEGPEFEMQMSDIQTWVSAALTDEDTCMDGFDEIAKKGKVKNIVRGYVVTVLQLTSNALALVNRLS